MYAFLSGLIYHWKTLQNSSINCLPESQNVTWVSWLYTDRSTFLLGKGIEYVVQAKDHTQKSPNLE